MAIKGVAINGVSVLTGVKFRENLRVFFFQGQYP